jgi:hypothetical protein
MAVGPVLERHARQRDQEIMDTKVAFQGHSFLRGATGLPFPSPGIALIPDGVRCLRLLAGPMRFSKDYSSGRVITLASLLVMAVTVWTVAHRSLDRAGNSSLVADLPTATHAEGESYSNLECSDVAQRDSELPNSAAACAFHPARAKVIRGQYRLTRRSVHRSVRPAGDVLLPTGAFPATTPFSTGSRPLAVNPFSALQHCVSLQRLLL